MWSQVFSKDENDRKDECVLCVCPCCASLSKFVQSLGLHKIAQKSRPSFIWVFMFQIYWLFH